MPNARTIIKGALLDLRVLAAGENPQANEAQDCLDALNDLADALGIDRLMMHELLRTPKTLTAGTASYTIGTGGSINIARPTWIDHAGLILDIGAAEPIEVEIDVLSDERYAAWSMKTQPSSRSSAIWYDHKWAAGLGTIYPLPIPNVSTTQLVLYTPGAPVSQFANLDTVYTWPNGYARMLWKILALEIAEMFSATPSALYVQQAAAAKTAIMSANVRPRRRVSSPGLVPCGGTWDMDSGGYE